MDDPIRRLIEQGSRHASGADSMRQHSFPEGLLQQILGMLPGAQQGGMQGVHPGDRNSAFQSLMALGAVPKNAKNPYARGEMGVYDRGEGEPIPKGRSPYAPLPRNFEELFDQAPASPAASPSVSRGAPASSAPMYSPHANENQFFAGQRGPAGRPKEQGPESFYSPSANEDRYMHLDQGRRAAGERYLAEDFSAFDRNRREEGERYLAEDDRRALEGVGAAADPAAARSKRSFQDFMANILSSFWNAQAPAKRAVDGDRGAVNSAQGQASPSQDRAPAGMLNQWLQASAPQGARPAQSAQGASPARTGTYVVKAGDNLSKIAQQLGVSAKELAAANGLADANYIFPGQELVLGGAARAVNPDDKYARQTAAAKQQSAARREAELLQSALMKMMQDGPQAFEPMPLQEIPTERSLAQFNR
jgi:LysM repeat protein